MLSVRNQRSASGAAVITLTFALILPFPGLAGPSHAYGSGKKKEKFVNGHDARDGRWGGQGQKPKDKPGRGDERDAADRHHERAEVRRQASDTGYREGYRAGSYDRSSRKRFDYRSQAAYRDAIIGYRDQEGCRELYRQSFRESFRRGYEDGFENRRPSETFKRLQAPSRSTSNHP